MKKVGIRKKEMLRLDKAMTELKALCKKHKVALYVVMGVEHENGVTMGRNFIWDETWSKKAQALFTQVLFRTTREDFEQAVKEMPHLLASLLTENIVTHTPNAGEVH